MTIFISKMHGRGLVFLPKEIRVSLETSEILLVHAGKAVLVIPRNYDRKNVIESINLIKKELELTS